VLLGVHGQVCQLLRVALLVWAQHLQVTMDQQGLVLGLVGRRHTLEVEVWRVKVIDTTQVIRLLMLLIHPR